MSNNLEPYYKMAASLDGKERAEKIQKEALACQNEIPFEISSWNQLQTAIKKENAPKMQKKRIKRLVATAAVIFLVIGFAGGIAVINIEALRIKVYNFFFSSQEKYTQVIAIPESVNPSLSGYYAPTLLPEGYHFVKIDGEGKNIEIYFSNDTGSIIRFAQLDALATATFDTENMEIHNIMIHGYKGFWESKHNHIMVVWTNGTLIFSLLVPKECENFIEIANSVQFCS